MRVSVTLRLEQQSHRRDNTGAVLRPKPTNTISCRAARKPRLHTLLNEYELHQAGSRMTRVLDVRLDPIYLAVAALDDEDRTEEVNHPRMLISLPKIFVHGVDTGIFSLSREGQVKEDFI